MAGLRAADRADPVLDLDAAYPAVGQGSWLVLTGRATTAILTVDKAELAGGEDFGITGRTTQVTLDADNTDLSISIGGRSRSTRRASGSLLADQPIERHSPAGRSSWSGPYRSRPAQPSL